MLADEYAAGRVRFISRLDIRDDYAYISAPAQAQVSRMGIAAGPRAASY